ncbi:hypothetical protein ABZ260_09565 [Streptosporangium sp. NPDC006013]|uniref:TetR family transcriptional regulator C-terminal domain-containing protein n=1 Tax=Streptosporangium sp. NPDC006013 TaxID=3155596 RepID=UPI0033BC8BC9
MAVTQVMAFYADQIRAAQAAGQVSAELDAAKVATILFAFAQGTVNPALAMVSNRCRRSI